MYLHCFMVAFVVRLSHLLFCDIWSSFFTQNDPFILTLSTDCHGHCVSSSRVSVFIQLIIILSQHITFKGIQNCLLAYIHVQNLTTGFISIFLSLLCLSKV